MNDRRDSQDRRRGAPRRPEPPRSGASDERRPAPPPDEAPRPFFADSRPDRDEVAAREAGIYGTPPTPPAAPREEDDREARRGRRRRRRPRSAEAPGGPGAPARPEPEERDEPPEFGEERADDGDWLAGIEEELAEQEAPEEPEEKETGDEDDGFDIPDEEPEAAPEPPPPPVRSPQGRRAPAPPPPPPPPPPADDFAAGIFEPEKVAVPVAPPEPEEPAPEVDEPDTVEIGPDAVEVATPPPPPPPPPPPTEKREDAPGVAAGVSHRWLREVYGEAVKKSPERRKEFTTSSGQPLAPLYGPSIRLARSFDDAVGYPGEYPFTRGVHPTMYRSRLWTMRQYAGFASARLTNERFRYLLEQGQTGLSVAFDLPTQIGYDSDDPRAEGEVGKCGVPINSLADMETLLAGIPLDKVSLSMTINSSALVMLLMVAAVAKKQGVPLAKVRGTVQNDMLKEFAARNTHRFSLDAHLRLTTDLFRFASAKMPEFNLISVSGYHMREKGCTAAQEVAFTLANGIAYVERAIAAGLPVNEFAGRLSFFFNAHNNVFEEVGKFRAARRLWARIMRERFKATDPKALMLRFHTQTAGSALTARQPLTNVVRVTLQALAGVLGGTQSLHTNSFDEALGLPTQEAALLALRTQQVIAFESGVADVVDPLGGCPLVEELTDRVEREASDYLRRIDEMGGAVAAVRSGWMTAEIETAAYNAQKAIESGDQVVVGVNRFEMDDAREPAVLKVDEEQARQVVDDLAALKRTRDNAKADAAITSLEISAAWGDVDLPDLVLRCVEAYCTLGEICRSLETVLAGER